MSYGLFHAVANPLRSWGVVRKVTFPGVNMDIGHVRNITWAKDNDRSKWIGYNRLRGQYMSALEHAVPERFFNDPSQCNLQGTTSPTAGLPDCPQGISAVKALGIAAAQGQKIYTITQQVYADNPNIVNTALQAHSYDTQSRIQQSLNAGLEVTVHERPITQSGWTGAGFTSIDPSTGAGAYTIEGGANGGFLSDNVSLWGAVLGLLIGFAGLAGALASVAIGAVVAFDQYLDLVAKGDCAAIWADISIGWNILSIVAAGIAGIFGTLLLAVVVGIFMVYIGLLLGAVLSLAADVTCKVKGN